MNKIFLVKLTTAVVIGGALLSQIGIAGAQTKSEVQAQNNVLLTTMGGFVVSLDEFMAGVVNQINTIKNGLLQLQSDEETNKTLKPLNDFKDGVSTGVEKIKKGLEGAKAASKKGDFKSEYKSLQEVKAGMDAIRQAVKDFLAADANQILQSDWSEKLGELVDGVHGVFVFDKEGLNDVLDQKLKLIEEYQQSIGQSVASVGRIGGGRYAVKIVNNGAPKQVCLGAGVVLENGTNCITVPSGVTQTTASVFEEGVSGVFSYYNSKGEQVFGSVRPPLDPVVPAKDVSNETLVIPPTSRPLESFPGKSLDDFIREPEPKPIFDPRPLIDRFRSFLF